LHISGTASIDKHGEIMYLNDVKKQTHRTIENIRALLAPHGASLNDMAYFIIYIRNIKDRHKVMEVLEKEIPEDIPVLLLEGAVCRTAWLVELEGIAIIPDSSEFPPYF
jgi:enamine deaminase RidA (YjgF/YER057c/UK114 family)